MHRTAPRLRAGSRSFRAGRITKAGSWPARSASVVASGAAVPAVISGSPGPLCVGPSLAGSAAAIGRPRLPSRPGHRVVRGWVRNRTLAHRDRQLIIWQGCRQLSTCSGRIFTHLYADIRAYTLLSQMLSNLKNQLLQLLAGLARHPLSCGLRPGIPMGLLQTLGPASGHNNAQAIKGRLCHSRRAGRTSGGGSSLNGHQRTYRTECRADDRDRAHCRSRDSCRVTAVCGVAAAVFRT
jgi:hypothetical protein